MSGDGLTFKFARLVLVLALVASACSSEPEALLVGGGGDESAAPDDFELYGTVWLITEKDGQPFGPPAMSMSFWELNGILRMAVEGDCGQGAGPLASTETGFVVTEMNWSDDGCNYGIGNILIPGTDVEASVEGNLLILHGAGVELIGRHFESQSVNHDEPVEVDKTLVPRARPFATTVPPRTVDHSSIYIPTHNWSSQLVGAEVIGSVLETAGFPVEYVPSDSGAPVYAAMCEGEIDLVHEVWETAFGVPFEENVVKGCVLDWATHDVVVREEWWYPAYMEERCPGLPDWEALNDCATLFATPETGEKGRYLGGPVEWQKKDPERIHALGMDFAVVHAGSADAIWAELDAAYAAEEPILSFNWTPNFVDARYEGKFVEFPEWEQACVDDPAWGINPDLSYDCGNPLGYLKLGVSSQFPERWPEAAAIVQRMEFTTQMLAEWAATTDIDGLSDSEAAAKWLEENEAVWQAWING